MNIAALEGYPLEFLRILRSLFESRLIQIKERIC